MAYFYKIVLLISIIFFPVNQSFALTEQLKHDSSIQWPTTKWSERDIKIDDEENFRKITNFLFSEESYDKNGRTNSLLIIQNGEIVFEQYNDPVTVTTKQISWSMAKSFVGALTGIMIDRGLISSVDETNLLPEWNDKRKFISIDDLLNMKSGLDFVEEYDTSGRSDTLEMLYGEGRLDQATYASSFPMKTIGPGMKYNYSTGETNILSKILKLRLEDAGLNYNDFIQENLAKKIGLNDTIFEFDKSNTFIGGSSVFSNARDYARFGYLYLRDGYWEDEQVISKQWIDASRKPVKHSYGMYSNKFWIVHPAFSHGLPKDTYYCAGFGGQYIIIIPSKDLVMVRLGETYIEDDNVMKNLGDLASYFPNAL